MERDFKAIRNREPGLLAHLGDLQFDPDDRLVHRDPDADLALLEVTRAEAEAVGRWIYFPPSWPPPPVTPGAPVGIAGYPAVVRERIGEKRVGFRGLTTQTPISSVNERQMSCAFNREEWIEVGAPGGATENDLGGISGGPVFALNGIQPRLVGVVAEHGPDLDILFIARLDRLALGDLASLAA